MIAVTAPSMAQTVFSLSNAGVVGSNPTRGMDVCVRLFCVQIAALRRADPPSKESYRLCVGLRNSKAAKFQRAVEL
jgi:hypothetical protein